MGGRNRQIMGSRIFSLISVLPPECDVLRPRRPKERSHAARGAPLFLVAWVAFPVFSIPWGATCLPPPPPTLPRQLPQLCPTLATPTRSPTHPHVRKVDRWPICSMETLLLSCVQAMEGRLSARVPPPPPTRRRAHPCRAFPGAYVITFSLPQPLYEVVGGGGSAG